MKQKIVNKQWDEIDKINKVKFGRAVDARVPRGEVLGVTWTFKKDFRPNIGEMIHFLGGEFEDYPNVIFENAKKVWLVIRDDEDNPVFEAKELCDALWTSVKEILND